MVTDSISDFIIRIKNASAAGKPTVSVSHSKMKEAIAQTLVKSGFLAGAEKKGKEVPTLEVTLAYEGTAPKVQGVERISKLSKRIYKGFAEIKPVRNGYGALIVSTPKGILTDSQVRKEKVGGELLFKIW